MEFCVKKLGFQTFLELRNEPLSRRLEIQRDRALHGSGASIQEIRLEVPLLYSIDGSPGKD